MTILVTLPKNVPIGTTINIKHSNESQEVLITYPDEMIYHLRKLNDNEIEIVALDNDKLLRIEIK
jgi:hypothetical protein